MLTMIPLLCGRARRDAVKSLKIYNVDDGIHGLSLGYGFTITWLRYPVPSTNAGRGGAASATRGPTESPPGAARGGARRAQEPKRGKLCFCIPIAHVRRDS